MKDIVYVTSNEHKAKYFSKMVGLDIPHLKIDLDEIQSVSLRTIVEHKAKQAYEKTRKPVIVEDTKLSFTALGGLPGPFIKWFMQELGFEGLCRLLDGKDRTAFAGAAMAYYDGVNVQIFERELKGEILQHPSSGDSGFGWNVIFKPKGAEKSFAEMNEEDFEYWYAKVKPFNEIAEFLNHSNA